MGLIGRFQWSDDLQRLQDAGLRALDEQRWEDAERLLRQALTAASEDRGALDERDASGVCFLEGRLVVALVEQGKSSEARTLLEASLAYYDVARSAGARSLVATLADLHLEAGAWQRAEELFRRLQAAQATRSWPDGRPPEPTLDLLALADFGVEHQDWDPIAAAERWAGELGARDLWFEASHRRGALAEVLEDLEGAIAEYTRLADHGTTYEKSYARLFILLERAGRHDEAVSRARSSLEVRRTANFEEQTKKRIQRLERRLAPKGSKPPKREVAAFSVREGQELLEWKAQVAIKGDVRAITRWADGLLVQSGGKGGMLYRIGVDLEILDSVREMPRGWRVIAAPDNRHVLLATRHGTVEEGSATVSALSDDWQPGAGVDLGGVISEVAVLGWGIGVGSRDGGLYGVDWAGRSLWTYRLPPAPGADPYFRPCPYFVHGAPEAGRVVFSSWSDVVCIGRDGREAWLFTIPAERREWRMAFPAGVSQAGITSATRLLGIPADADDEAVKSAFRRRARETHPDTSGRDPREFVALRDAYETLLGREDDGGGGDAATFTMEMGRGSITSVHATSDGGAWASATNGQAFRVDALGRLLVSLPAAKNYSHLLVDAADRLIAVSDWDGITIFSSDGHPIGGQPLGQLLELGLSPDERLITGYGRKELYLFSRSGALISHVEFSKTIADLAWVGDVLYVGAGKLIALVPRADVSLPSPR